MIVFIVFVACAFLLRFIRNKLKDMTKEQKTRNANQRLMENSLETEPNNLDATKQLGSNSAEG